MDIKKQIERVIGEHLHNEINVLIDIKKKKMITELHENKFKAIESFINGLDKMSITDLDEMMKKVTIELTSDNEVIIGHISIEAENDRRVNKIWESICNKIDTDEAAILEMKGLMDKQLASFYKHNSPNIELLYNHTPSGRMTHEEVNSLCEHRVISAEDAAWLHGRIDR